MGKVMFAVMILFVLAACDASEESSMQGQDKNSNFIAADTQTESANEGTNSGTETEGTQQLQEYPYLKEHMNLSDYHLNIIEDNLHKRIIFLENENGQKIYKTIFIKDTGRLKIVEFDKGLLFNDII